ncbi:MAG: hypothetical protein ACYDHU_09125 [Acidimicrobiales bacterium]
MERFRAEQTPDEIDAAVRLIAADVLSGVLKSDDARRELMVPGYQVAITFAGRFVAAELGATAKADLVEDAALRLADRAAARADWRRIYDGASYCGYVRQLLRSARGELLRSARGDGVLDMAPDTLPVPWLVADYIIDTLDPEWDEVVDSVEAKAYGAVETERSLLAAEYLTLADDISLVDRPLITRHLTDAGTEIPTQDVARSIVGVALMWSGRRWPDESWSSVKIWALARAVITPRPRLRAAQMVDMVRSLMAGGMKTHRAHAVVRIWDCYHSDLAVAAKDHTAPVRCWTRGERVAHLEEWTGLMDTERDATDRAAIECGARVDHPERAGPEATTRRRNDSGSTHRRPPRPVAPGTGSTGLMVGVRVSGRIVHLPISERSRLRHTKYREWLYAGREAPAEGELVRA